MDPLIHPAGHAATVTPHDSNDLEQVTRGLYVGTVGDVRVDMASGATVTLSALAAGIVHPLRVKRVYSTDTTATGIVALY